MPRKEAAPQTTNENTPDDGAPRLEIAERYQRESNGDQSPAENPVDTTVEDATSRLETIEGRGSEIRTKIKETLRTVGRSVGNFIVRNGDRALGATVVGAEKARDYTKSAVEYASDLKDAASQRYAQRAERRERREFTAERATSEQFYADRAEAAAQQEAIDAAHEEAIDADEQYDAAYANQQALNKAADSFKNPAYSTIPESYNSEQRSAAERANREALMDAHLEAIAEDDRRTAENEARIAEEEARIEREGQEYSSTYAKAEDFLAQFKGRKNTDLTEIRQALHSELSEELASEQHHIDAIDDAFGVFTGKKIKQAVRAERIAKGRARVTELRTAAYETGRDKTSAVYQTAKTRSKTFGKAIARFSKRTASAVKSSFSAFQTSWQETKAAAEAEPQTNE